MNFTFQALTWGFLIALAPLLIHLINMMRHRRVKWAAMDFLLASYKKHRRWVWLKQLLLLLLRMFIVAIIVAMLAQWDPGSSWLNRFGGRETHHFILLDDSYSMSETSGGTSAFDTASKVVSRLGLRASQMNNQRFTLIRFSRATAAEGTSSDETSELADQFSDFAGAFVDSDFSNRLSDRQEEIQVTQLSTGPLPALEMLGNLLPLNRDQHRMVYVVSDFRKNEWENTPQIKESLSQIQTDCEEIHFVDCVKSTVNNLAITGLQPADDTRAAGVPLFMHLHVHNYGQQPATNVQVKLRSIFHAPDQVDSSEPTAVVGQIDELPLLVIDTINPGETVVKRVQVFFPEAGQHVVDAQLPEDSVLADNRRWTVLDFPDGDHVLLVDGSPGKRNEYYLNSVFRPSQLTNTGIIPNMQPLEYLRDTTPEALSKYSAIYLMDVARLDTDAIANLEKYVSQGGGLGIFAGDQMDIQFYNDQLYKQGQGLLPVQLAGPALLVPPLDEATPHLDIQDHPVFDFFLNERNPLIRRVKIDQYIQSDPDWKPADDSTAEIICRLHNQQPFAVEQSYGQGRVVCFLSTLSADWNNWSQDPSFVVVTLKLHAHLTSTQRLLDQRHVGSEITIPLDISQFRKEVTFLPPHDDATTRPIEKVQAQSPDPQSPIMVASLGSSSQSSQLESTGTSGVYDAIYQRLDGEFEARRFVLNVDTREGDTTVLNRQNLISDLSPIKIELNDLDDFLGSTIQQAGGAASFWIMLLLLAGLVGEQFLAYTISYHPPAGSKS
ncbi:MAG: BatA domain-containing protein [Planctomycetota bacterium]|nr:BatA domain-containing protein [Planctomycetota bacterium]